jgi:hypothetical protein
MSSLSSSSEFHDAAVDKNDEHSDDNNDGDNDGDINASGLAIWEFLHY